MGCNARKTTTNGPRNIKFTEHKSKLSFSLQLLSETFLILRIQRNTVINVQGGSNMTGTDLYVNNSAGDTLPHTVVGVCGEFQRTGRFLQRGI